MNTPDTKPSSDNDTPRVENTTSPTAKERSIKALAVLGFIGIVIIIAWLIINLVAVIPNLASSVASIISTQNDPQLEVLTNKDSVESGESVKINWESSTNLSSYAFSFACEEGVRAEIRTSENGTQTISCDSQYSFSNINELLLTIHSDSSRFVNTQYTIYGYRNENDTDPLTKGGFIEVVNHEVNIASGNQEEEEKEDNNTSDDTTETANTNQQTGTSYTYQEEYSYRIPTSDPNGYTDLALSYKGVGTLNSNHNFVPAGSFSPGDTGAIKFAVKNIGTKTSDTWTYTATLPNGTKYTSKSQLSLKPNEIATITLGFRAPYEEGVHPFSVSIRNTRDINKNNHSFSWSVTTK